MSLVLFIGYPVSQQKLQIVPYPYSHDFTIYVQGAPIGTLHNNQFKPRDYRFGSPYSKSYRKTVAPVK